MNKKKVRVYPEKNGISVRGSEWTLWIRQVKTKEGKTMYVVKPLETHYNPQKQSFHYEDLKRPIWLNQRDFNELLSALKGLTAHDDHSLNSTRT